MTGPMAEPSRRGVGRTRCDGVMHERRIRGVFKIFRKG